MTVRHGGSEAARSGAAPAVPPTWAEHAFRVLAERGHRAGGARAAVIEALAERGGCVTAKELVHGLAGGARPVGLASVYRALAALETAGLVHSVDLGGAERHYELVHDDGAHHHHVVCDRCGRKLAFSDPELERAIGAIGERLGAQLEAHDVVLRGTCARCSGSAGR
jgi:Fur family ferric uptake transcriptional regulator